MSDKQQQELQNMSGADLAPFVLYVAFSGRAAPACAELVAQYGDNPDVYLQDIKLLHRTRIPSWLSGVPCLVIRETREVVVGKDECQSVLGAALAQIPRSATGMGGASRPAASRRRWRPRKRGRDAGGRRGGLQRRFLPERGRRRTHGRARAGRWPARRPAARHGRKVGEAAREHRARTWRAGRKIWRARRNPMRLCIGDSNWTCLSLPAAVRAAGGRPAAHQEGPPHCVGSARHCALVAPSSATAARHIGHVPLRQSHVRRQS